MRSYFVHMSIWLRVGLKVPKWCTMVNIKLEPNLMRKTMLPAKLHGASKFRGVITFTGCMLPFAAIWQWPRPKGQTKCVCVCVCAYVYAYVRLCCIKKKKIIKKMYPVYVWVWVWLSICIYIYMHMYTFIIKLMDFLIIYLISTFVHDSYQPLLLPYN